MKTTKLTRLLWTIALVFSIGIAPLPVSAHEAGVPIESQEIIVSGTLEDGTPYTLSIIVPDEANINIVDSKYYYFKATFAWGTTAPASMNVSIPMNGGIYRGTLQRVGDQINDTLAYEVYAYYGGTIIGVI